MQTRQVLVVEDSPGIRRLIEVCLRPLAVEMHTAGDGPSGLEAARRVRPDLLILDIGLPHMDGWEVLRNLRADDDGSDGLPVLVLTAHAEEESRRRATEGGADGFVTKPFQPDDLRAEVERLLGA